MTDNHPITPPSELVDQWDSECESAIDAAMHLATQAARWGADQELEACVEWMAQRYGEESPAMGLLRAARRPKPPSLKEQALSALDQADRGLSESEWQQRSDTIRRALEQLDD